MNHPVAGLFGKLPAHGDFVRRGWSDQTVDAVDRWLTGGIATAHGTRDDDDFATWMHAAPLWQGYVPPGLLGPLALHVGVAASIDRAGRLFPIAAGVAGDADATWAVASRCGAVLEAAIYDALAGLADADAMVDALAPAEHAVRPPGPAPTLASWWLGSPDDGAPMLASACVDAVLLERLLSEGQR